MAKRSITQEETVQFYGIQQRHKTYRMAFVCGTVVLCVGVIGWVVVRMTDQPPWLVVLLSILGPTPTACVCLAGVGAFRKYVKNRNGRIVELEQLVDDRRTSTGLLEDGREPE